MKKVILILFFFWLPNSFAKVCMHENAQLSTYIGDSILDMDSKLVNWNKKGEVYEAYSLQLNYDRLIEYLFVCKKIEELLLIEEKITREFNNITLKYGFRCITGIWCDRIARKSKIIPLAVVQFSYFYFKLNWMWANIAPQVENDPLMQMRKKNILYLMDLQQKIMAERASNTRIRDIDLFLYLNGKYYENLSTFFNLINSDLGISHLWKIGKKIRASMIIDQYDRLVFNSDMHTYIPYNKNKATCATYKYFSNKDLGWDISHSRRINYLFTDYKRFGSMQPIYVNEAEYQLFRKAFVNRVADLLYEDEVNIKMKNYFNGDDYCYQHPSGRLLEPGQAIRIVNNLGYSEYANENIKLKRILTTIKDLICAAEIDAINSKNCLDTIVKQ